MTHGGMRHSTLGGGTREVRIKVMWTRMDVVAVHVTETAVDPSPLPHRLVWSPD
jgi:hypothetical protein